MCLGLFRKSECILRVCTYVWKEFSTIHPALQFCGHVSKHDFMDEREFIIIFCIISSIFPSPHFRQHHHLMHLSTLQKLLTWRSGVKLYEWHYYYASGGGEEKRVS